jgi:hypothetical protein
MTLAGGGLGGWLLKLAADRWLRRTDADEARRDAAIEKEQSLMVAAVRQTDALALRLDTVVERLSERHAETAQVIERVDGMGAHYGERVRAVEQRLAHLEGQFELVRGSGK